MKKLLLLSVVVVSALLGGCGSDPSAPAVGKVFLNRGRVVPGTTVTVIVEMFLQTDGSDSSNRQSEPFSLLVSLPGAVTYVAGSSALPFQSNREPNASGVCADGHTYLLYDFARGEINNSFNFKDLTDDLSLDVVVSLAADATVVAATASSATPADPCVAVEDEKAKFSVKAS